MRRRKANQFAFRRLILFRLRRFYKHRAPPVRNAELSIAPHHCQRHIVHQWPNRREILYRAQH